MALPALQAQYFASVVMGTDRRVVRENLVAYYELGSGPFGYDPYRNAVVEYLAGRCTAEQAVTYCTTRGAKAGRLQNVIVTRLVCPFVQARVGFSARLKRDRFTFRRDLYVSIGPIVLCKDGGKPVLLTTQPRKTWNMSSEERRLWATLIMRVHGADGAPVLFETDEPNHEIEILDLSAGLDGIRQVTPYRFREEELMSESEFNFRLQNFADAHDALVAEGYVPRKKRPRKSDPSQPGLFDDILE